MSSASRTFSLSSYLYRHKINEPPGGYLHPYPFIIHGETKQLEQKLILLAKKVLEDPLLKQEMCERILILMQEDIEREKERCQPTGRRF